MARSRYSLDERVEATSAAFGWLWLIHVALLVSCALTDAWRVFWMHGALVLGLLETALLIQLVVLRLRQRRAAVRRSGSTMQVLWCSRVGVDVEPEWHSAQAEGLERH